MLQLIYFLYDYSGLGTWELHEQSWSTSSWHCVYFMLKTSYSLMSSLLPHMGLNNLLSDGLGGTHIPFHHSRGRDKWISELMVILAFRASSRTPCVTQKNPVLKPLLELALSYSHTDEYLAYHHRPFTWRWMKLETETHIGAQDWAPKVQIRSRRRENMSREVRTARGTPTH